MRYIFDLIRYTCLSEGDNIVFIGHCDGCNGIVLRTEIFIFARP